MFNIIARFVRRCLTSLSTAIDTPETMAYAYAMV